ncbi:hypothetical protein [Streptomyces fuscigenes]|uniref:hypothetical protein n=1 Tax=Streptomyces fuscigenes TaxID=1528880 RepID=UPI001F2AA96A|nr:hypothetical protein [Streptomyces fuscigenes]MCF3963332.1 hypothetical protein [Streptomyces fuscigenes]
MGRKGKGRRAAAVAISGVAAVGVLAGCGGTSGGSGGSSAASGSASDGATGAAGAGSTGSAGSGGANSAAVQSAYQKTSDAKSAKMTIATTVGGVGGSQSLSLTGSGVIDLAKGASDVTLHLGSQQIQERTVDGMLYEKLPPAAAKQLLPAGRTWLKLDLKKVAGTLGSGSGATAGMSDPAAPFSYVKNLSGQDVTKVGTETVNGTKTTHYRVSVDVTKLSPGNSAQARMLQQQLGDRLPVDLWLDDQGRIRQEEVKAKVNTSGGASPSAPSSQSPSSQSPGASTPPQQLALDSKLQFSDFGTQANVSAPPAAQTADMTKKITQGAAGAASASPDGS